MGTDIPYKVAIETSSRWNSAAQRRALSPKLKGLIPMAISYARSSMLRYESWRLVPRQDGDPDHDVSCVFLAQLDSTVVYLGLKHIGDDLRAGVSQLQWVLDSYNLVYATLLLTGGALGDLYGRLRVFACGIAYSRLADLRVRPERCHADRRPRRHRSRLGFGSPDIACHPHRDLS
jgi:hypothetical protein